MKKQDLEGDSRMKYQQIWTLYSIRFCYSWNWLDATDLPLFFFIDLRTVYARNRSSCCVLDVNHFPAQNYFNFSLTRAFGTALKWVNLVIKFKCCCPGPKWQLTQEIEFGIIIIIHTWSKNSVLPLCYSSSTTSSGWFEFRSEDQTLSKFFCLHVGRHNMRLFTVGARVLRGFCLLASCQYVVYNLVHIYIFFFIFGICRLFLTAPFFSLS